MENGESSSSFVPSVLPRETELVSNPYLPWNLIEKQKIDATLLADRAGDAQEQTEFLNNLPITNIKTALSTYYEPTMAFFNGEEVGRPGINDTAGFLQDFFPTKRGYGVFDQGEKGHKKYIIAKKGAGGVSDMVMVFKDAKYRENQWEFILEKHVYLNRDTNKAFDYANVINESGYKTRFYVNEWRDGFSGRENTYTKNVEIHISEEADVQQVPYVGTHEFGHTFQVQRFLKGGELWAFIDVYSLPFRFLFPKLKPKIFPEFRRQRQYQDAVKRNLNERNADAFAMALMRRLEKEGLQVMPREDIKNQTQIREVERVENDSYKPKV